MKKLLISIIALLMSQAILMAQDLAFLKNERYVYIAFNYSQCDINGYRETNVLDLEKGWYKNQPKLQNNFTRALNDVFGVSLTAGEYTMAKYTLEVRPIFIGEKGNMAVYVCVRDNDEEGLLVYKTDVVISKGSHADEFIDRLASGMKSSGTKVGKELKKLMYKK